ncbi:MAG: HAD family hydrolase [Zetaproteobacteria bacterium]|nr:HAD family hydrolase [Zetaproteobacteria bacterium]
MLKHSHSKKPDKKNDGATLPTQRAIPKYKTIIFDFDGTLFDSQQAIRNCIQLTFENFPDLPAPQEEFVHKALQTGITLEDTLSILGVHSPAIRLNMISCYRTTYEEVSSQHEKPFTGTQSILQQLHAQDYQLMVVSNKSTRSVESALRTHHLHQYFSLIVGNTPGIAKKPNPSSFHKLVRPVLKPETLPSQVLMVGDTIADIIYAQNIGTDSCWARYGYGQLETCQAYQPTYTIHTLTELGQLFSLQQSISC